MKIGIIGIGCITVDFANRASIAGYEVLISQIQNNRALSEVVETIGKNVKLVSIDEAVQAEIVILFVPREKIEFLMQQLPDMTEKIILHTNNKIFSLEPLKFNSGSRSSSEIIASFLPTAHVVTVYNVMQPMIIMPRRPDQNNNDIFYTAANKYIKEYVRIFLESLDFAGHDLAELYQFSALN
ncbi:NAD(P)-binding domain-containing protein [Flavobacterium sp. 2]|uniref:NAD(P)-binding domain-containing protein n=1 Tax=Flavobacterium sp. 2 TaxID=308053 RepID=UPI003CF687F5